MIWGGADVIIEIEYIINLLPAPRRTGFFHENQSLVLKRLEAAGLKGSLCTPFRRGCGDRRVRVTSVQVLAVITHVALTKLLRVEVMKNGQILEIL